MENYDDHRTHNKNIKVRKVVYFILSILEVLFTFRLIFKLLGANTASPFTSFIYAVTGAFIAPFNGIFRSAVSQGIETNSVLEPTTIIAMIVYALIAYGVVRFIELNMTHKNKEI